MNTKTTPIASQDAAIASLGLSQAKLAVLSQEQITQQADLAQRLLGMAINGTPRVDDQAFPAAGVDLALHALLTAYMSLADAYPFHTQLGAHMAAQAAVCLDHLSARRGLHAPASQVQ